MPKYITKNNNRTVQKIHTRKKKTKHKHNTKKQKTIVLEDKTSKKIKNKSQQEKKEGNR